MVTLPWILCWWGLNLVRRPSAGSMACVWRHHRHHQRLNWSPKLTVFYRRGFLSAHDFEWIISFTWWVPKRILKPKFTSFMWRHLHWTALTLKMAFCPLLAIWQLVCRKNPQGLFSNKKFGCFLVWPISVFEYNDFRNMDRPARVRKFDQCPDLYVYLPFIQRTKMTLSRCYNNICHYIETGTGRRLY